MIIVGDIGGTHMRIAASDTWDSFEEPLVLDTPQALDEAVAVFTSAVSEVAKGHSVSRAVLGIAGLVSSDESTLLRAPHLRSWEGTSLADAFGQAISAPVRVKNDAMLGGLGEAHFGAGAGASILAYITVSTGVGGARIVDGAIDRSAHGFEIGHQRLGTTLDAPELESLISGAGVEKLYGRPASELDNPAIWDACADYLAIGLYNTILHWSPECIVLGGPAFRLKNKIPLPRVKDMLKQVATAVPELPDIRLATLGDNSGLYGALALSGND